MLFSLSHSHPLNVCHACVAFIVHPGVHQEGGLERASAEVPFSREQIQRYIQFARTINPKITAESRPVLVECYRLLRSNDLLGKNKTAYRITVRQLESLIRLAEALARLHLDENVRTVKKPL
jgi:DNA replicative helicase MCM subunit Mcm2 (Cdc46/Mcm family)